MTSRLQQVRTGTRRSAPRGAIVLLLSGTALIAATTMHVDGPEEGWLTRSADDAIEQQSEHTTSLLNAVRGANPLTCRLANRALEDRWGGRRTVVPGPESIGEAADAVFDWSMTTTIEPALIPQLRAALADADGCVLRTAATLLGRVRTANLGGELRTELASASARTREAALLAIGYAGNGADVEAAVQRLQDTDPAVKLAAVWALGRIGEPQAVGTLTGLLADHDPIIRATAAHALGQIESADAIPALAALLGSDADARVRRAAAVALGQIDQ